MRSQPHYDVNYAGARGDKKKTVQKQRFQNVRHRHPHDMSRFAARVDRCQPQGGTTPVCQGTNPNIASPEPTDSCLLLSFLRSQVGQVKERHQVTYSERVQIHSAGKIVRPRNVRTRRTRSLTLRIFETFLLGWLSFLPVYACKFRRALRVRTWRSWGEKKVRK